MREPRIYFGQGEDRYAIVKGSTPEFDYPKGKDNVYASYDGADGISLGDPAWRSLFSWYYGDPNILLTDYITNAEPDPASSQHPGPGAHHRPGPAASTTIPISW